MAGTTDYAILGILTLGEQSGYDIKKLISESIGYFWQESYGQLYPALKKMVELEWVTMHVEKNEGKPDKKVYRITSKGRQSLKKWLEEPIHIPKIRHELLLKLFFGLQSDVAVNVKHVAEYKEKCLLYLEELKQVKVALVQNQKGNPASKYWLITISNGLYAIKAEIAWCDETLTILSKE